MCFRLKSISIKVTQIWKIFFKFMLHLRNTLKIIEINKKKINKRLYGKLESLYIYFVLDEISILKMTFQKGDRFQFGFQKGRMYTLYVLIQFLNLISFSC